VSEDQEKQENETSSNERSSSDDRSRSRGASRGRSNDRSKPRPGRRRGRRRESYCPDGKCFDYKDVETLRRFLGETGKIKPRRQTGNCARCQRELAREIKRARHLALLPFVSSGE